MSISGGKMYKAIKAISRFAILASLLFSAYSALRLYAVDASPRSYYYCGIMMAFVLPWWCLSDYCARKIRGNVENRQRRRRSRICSNRLFCTLSVFVSWIANLLVDIVLLIVMMMFFSQAWATFSR